MWSVTVLKSVMYVNVMYVSVMVWYFMVSVQLWRQRERAARAAGMWRQRGAPPPLWLSQSMNIDEKRRKSRSRRQIWTESHSGEDEPRARWDWGTGGTLCALLAQSEETFLDAFVAERGLPRAIYRWWRIISVCLNIYQSCGALGL